MKKQFIRAGSATCDYDRPVPAPCLRRSFQIDRVPENAVLRVCGLGFYRLFLNGREITRGRLVPTVSNPDDLCYYDTYAVAADLLAGENVVGVILGNGMMNAWGGDIWKFDKAAWRAAPCLCLELEADGRVILRADEAFRTHSSPIREDDLRLGETYDARCEMPGWSAPGFDDGAWSPAEPAPAPKGELLEYPAAPVRVVAERAPVSVTKTATGYLYDFGVNTAAIVRLRLRNAEPGQTLTLWFGEQVMEGALSRKSISFDGGHPAFDARVQRDIYVARGTAEEVWEPSFTYHGYRYIDVRGLRPDQAVPETLTMLEEHSDIPDVGGFRCSDPYVNKLVGMIRNSDLSNFFYFPTDCPHREKNGWTGDAAASAERMLSFYDCAGQWREWLRSVRLAQNAEGALPGIVPTGGWGFAWGNGPAWDRVLIRSVWLLWRDLGDPTVIEENADAMLAYLRYVAGRRNEKGTLAIGLGDWCPVGLSSGRYPTPNELTDSILVMQMATQAAGLFGVVGRTAEKTEAETLAAEMRAAIRAHLLNKETATLCQGTQTGQAMGLRNNVFEPDERDRAFAVLLDLIRQKGDRFDCGYLGMMDLFDVLTDFGEADLAYRLAMQPGFPSYREWIDRGETSLCECFRSDHDKHLMSHNHHFFGDIAGWFFRRVAGVRVLSHDRVEIRPVFLSALTFAEGWTRLPAGEVRARWERRPDGTCSVTYTCPPGVSCSVGPLRGH